MRNSIGINHLNLNFIVSYLVLVEFFNKRFTEFFVFTAKRELDEHLYMLFAGWEVRTVKNCDRGLEKNNELYYIYIHNILLQNCLPPLLVKWTNLEVTDLVFLHKFNNTFVMMGVHA